jgi:hypothetical protein
LLLACVLGGRIQHGHGERQWALILVCRSRPHIAPVLKLLLAIAAAPGGVCLPRCWCSSGTVGVGGAAARLPSMIANALAVTYRHAKGAAWLVGGQYLCGAGRMPCLPDSTTHTQWSLAAEGPPRGALGCMAAAVWYAPHLTNTSLGAPVASVVQRCMPGTSWAAERLGALTPHNNKLVAADLPLAAAAVTWCMHLAGHRAWLLLCHSVAQPATCQEGLCVSHMCVAEFKGGGWQRWVGSLPASQPQSCAPAACCSVLATAGAAPWEGWKGGICISHGRTAQGT